MLLMNYIIICRTPKLEKQQILKGYFTKKIPLSENRGIKQTIKTYTLPDNQFFSANTIILLENN
jgi:hypothetical protein